MLPIRRACTPVVDFISLEGRDSRATIRKGAGVFSSILISSFPRQLRLTYTTPVCWPPLSLLFSLVSCRFPAVRPLPPFVLPLFSLSLSFYCLLVPPGVDTPHPAGNTLGAGHPLPTSFHSTIFNSSRLPPSNRYIPTTMAVQILPEICILPPPPSEDLVQPFSPFDSMHLSVDELDDDFRPALLSPPPTMHSIPRHLSPLSPPDVPVKGQGLERERFEQLLKSSRDRSIALGNKRSLDLRKELAVKTHKSKQSASSPRHLSLVRHVDPLFLFSGTPCALLNQSGGTTLPECRS